MKTAATLALLLLTLFTTAQDNPENLQLASDTLSSKSKPEFGFSFGLNYSNFVVDAPNAIEEIGVDNHAGFRLGLLADFKVKGAFHITPRAELSFHDGAILFPLGDQNGFEKIWVMPVYFSFINHFGFEKDFGSVASYFFLGPNFRMPVPQQSEVTVFNDRNDIAIDLGIGLDKAFKQFHFAPELRYSYGLNNLFQGDSAQDVRFHNVSLVFNFKG